MSFPKRNILSSKKKIKLDHTKETRQVVDWKPRGLWYSCNNEWHQFLKGEWPERLEETPYLHRVTLEKNSCCFSDVSNPAPNCILRIASKNDLTKFRKKYGMGEYVDWRPVAKDYAGVEFCPWKRIKSGVPMWYDTLDTSSGCIWRTKGIVKNITFVRKL